MRNLNAQSLALLSEADRHKVLAALSDEEAAALLDDWTFWARPNQLAPTGDWRIWLILAGRGFGKSRAVNEWAIEQARKYPKSRGALVAATAGDVRDVVVEGISGVLNIAPADFTPRYEPSKRRLTFPNGSMATTFSADEPRALRGPQFHWAICDELAAWRYLAAFDMLLMGVRLGSDPRIAISTTPRPIKAIRELLSDPTCVVTRGTTYENRANLAPKWYSDIISKYEGSRLGRQELNAEVLDDIEGALWKRDDIDSTRVQTPPQLTRIVLAIDPAVTATEDSDETGIIVAGIAQHGDGLHGYILSDLSLRGSPAEWARSAIGGYYHYEADRIVGEVNNGGDMIGHTLATIDPTVPFTAVRASRGKQTRAEPIAALYEQHRVHHVGAFPALEDQMCSWVAGAPGMKSPDRVDALVWALTELMIDGSSMSVGELPDDVAYWRG